MFGGVWWRWSTGEVRGMAVGASSGIAGRLCGDTRAVRECAGGRVLCRVVQGKDHASSAFRPLGIQRSELKETGLELQFNGLSSYFHVTVRDSAAGLRPQRGMRSQWWLSADVKFPLSTGPRVQPERCEPGYGEDDVCFC